MGYETWPAQAALVAGAMDGEGIVTGVLDRMQWSYRGQGRLQKGGCCGVETERWVWICQDQVAEAWYVHIQTFQSQQTTAHAWSAVLSTVAV